LRTAVAICSAVTPSASIAAGSRSMLTARRVPPTSVTEPTPRTFSMRFLSVCSAQVVSSTAEGTATPPPGRPKAGAAPSGGSEPRAAGSVGATSGSTATDQIERADGSKRSTRGSLTSVRRVGRRIAIFSRTSSAALRPSMCSWNSMMTTDWPS
jgi:hypothetical protein